MVHTRLKIHSQDQDHIMQLTNLRELELKLVMLKEMMGWEALMLQDLESIHVLGHFQQGQSMDLEDNRNQLGISN